MSSRLHGLGPVKLIAFVLHNPSARRFEAFNLRYMGQ